MTSKTNDFLTDLFSRRGEATQGGNQHIFIAELNGGSAIEMTEFEPDPKTFRSKYYYNTKINKLYVKITSEKNLRTGVRIAHWKPISQ